MSRGVARRQGLCFRYAQAPTTDVYIGANPGASDQVFDGRIDDVKIFGRVLSSAEIALEMATPVAPPPPPPPSPPTVSYTYRGCSAGSMNGYESEALLWLLLGLVGLGIRRQRSRQDVR